VPTDAEWEKAARGADGRPFTYGNVFHALWQKAGRSSFHMTFDRVFRYPVDESPFGVFDLGGSIVEWNDRSPDTVPGPSLTLRGTAWSLSEERKVYAEWAFPKDLAMAEAGFRLAIHFDGVDSRPGSRPESR
jgi:formylglycine-generating enzyme required for sulfatase activity